MSAAASASRSYLGLSPKPLVVATSRYVAEDAVELVAEDLSRRGQVEGDDAVEAESGDPVHGRNLANIGNPATGNRAMPRG